MNYYDAREIQDTDSKGTGKWHYTSLNRRSGTHPVGYCADHGGHDSADEACECFRRYLLDGVREESYGDWTGCEVCGVPTKKGLTQRPPLGHGYPLCDKHRTHEQLEKLTGPIHQIQASY